MRKFMSQVVSLQPFNDAGRLSVRRVHQAAHQRALERPLQVSSVDRRGCQRPACRVDQVVGQLVGKAAAS